MVYKWNKGENRQLSAHFWTHEFVCPCVYKACVEQRVSCELISKLEQVRYEYGYPLTVLSGWRCAAHQSDLASQGYETAKGLSQHELGQAADIQGQYAVTLKQVATRYFKAIGIAKTWLHVDTRGDKIRRWGYK